MIRFRHRLVPAAVVLLVVVVVAAGAGGTAHLGEPRWWPHITFRAGRGRLRSDTPTAPPTQSPGHLPWVFWVCVGLLCLIAALGLATWYASRVSRGEPRGHQPALGTRAPAQPPAVRPDEPAVRSGVEQALRWLDPDGPPADAVLRAWLGLQTAAERSGVARGAAETATEFTTRIMGQVFTDDRAVSTLLRLYLRVRFGDHPVGTDDVARARAALQDLAGTSIAGPAIAAAGQH